jgi:hypothetical protein
MLVKRNDEEIWLIAISSHNSDMSIVTAITQKIKTIPTIIRSCQKFEFVSFISIKLHPPILILTIQMTTWST